MIASVLPSKVPEGHVVRAGRVLRGVGRLALVVGVVGHQVTSVHVGGELEIFQTEGEEEGEEEIITTKGVSMIILITDSVSGWILWSKSAP